ncbi:hypothetical protein SALWKB12_0553 [Snodgrassella communis]|nr:hypothetical protein SALWKB12_2115 [Snodgrassella communis]KDN11808.1 hypothetical protein SALWKB12_1730 [Snodgrassella communis]KDN11969.1 hypothetical protein SALWKB12_1891 [Snodgrassella communis]KDN13698.1 hypothetical protein SALWKB12_0553 [Snodgrassella communis]
MPLLWMLSACSDALAMLALVCVLSAAMMLPLLLSLPSALMTTPPALAKIWPALLIPTPLSLLISTILPAYMPPSLPVSMAMLGLGSLLLVLGVMCCVSASMWLLPLMMLRLLAQMPALICAALLRMWV